MKALLRALLFGSALALVAPAAATVNNAASSVTVGGTGQQTQFSFGFTGVAATYIGAIYTDPSGNQTVLSQGTAANQFQVAINAPSAGFTWGIGGTVTYNPNGTPIPAGSSLTVFRTLPLVQAVSLQNQASYGAVGKSAEKASDLLEMQLQQVAAQTQRAVLGNIANAAPAPLPAAAIAANQGVCFDTTGTSLIACSLIPSATVSSAVLPLLASASIAAFRGQLGEGALASYGLGAGIENDGANNARTSNTLIGDSVGTQVTASFFHQQHAAFGPITYTLLPGSQYWNGFSFTIYTYNAPTTLVIASNDAFIGLSSGQSLTLPVGSVTTITDNGGTNAAWAVQQAGSPLAPIHAPGEIIKLRTTSCPAGSLGEDGSAVSRSTFAALFAAIGTSWGAGDGSTTFNLPNSQGYFDRNFPGGTLDANRTMGVAEADQLQAFAVTVATTAGPGSTGGLSSASGNNVAPQYVNPTNLTGNVTGTAGALRTGAETRPKNIPALSCIWTGQIL